jgi:hypothetical protein
VNVLLLPRTETAAAVAAQLARWSAAGLLRPFCLSDTEEAASLSTRRVCGGAAESMPLSRALGDAPEEPEAVEVIAFYPVAAGEEADAGFADAVKRFLERSARRVFDAQSDRVVTCVSAVAPEGQGQQLPPALYRSGWANLLVAPEDRASPGKVNRLEEGGDRFLRHAAHAAATIGALWVTPEANLPDLPARLRGEPAGTLQVPVRVVRCYSRIVELGYIVDHIAAATFECRGGWPRPGKAFERAQGPERLLVAVANAYMARHNDTLVRRPFTPIRDVPPPPPDLITALLKLGHQIVTYVRRLPSRLLEEAIAAVHERAADYIEVISRSTGRITVRRWREAAEEGEGLASLDEALAKEPLVIEDGAVEGIWTDLRKTTLGLVDGSPLPDGIRAQVLAPGDRTKVVLDPALLAHDPAAVAVAEELGEEAEAEEAGTRADPEEEDEAPAPFLELIRGRVSAAREEALARVAALERPAPERSEEGEEEPAGKRPRRGGRWLRGVARRILWLLFAAMVAIAVATTLLPVLAAAAATVAVFAALFLALGFVARDALRRPPIPDDDQAAAELRELNRILELAQARGDAERLGRRLGELDTWIEILAELVHHPWVREPFEGLEIAATADEESLPAACRVAVADPDRRLLEELGRDAREKAFRRGWLSSIYRAVHALVVADQPGRDGEAALLDAAADTDPGDDETLRGALLDAVRRGRGRSRLDNPIVADLLASVDAAPLGTLAPAVLPASPDVRPLGPTATWIAPPPGAAAVAASRGAQVVALGGGSSGVLVAPDLALAAGAAVTEWLRAVARPGEPPVGIAETQLPEGTGLALLRLAGSAGEPVEIAAARPPAGAGVVALEATAEGIEHRWGYVIAAELEVIYDDGPPGLGAPVFDLDGRLCALQGERERLLPVPPLAELQAMPPAEPLPAGAQNGHAAAPLRSAPEFLAAIAAPDRAGELLRGYWASRTQARAVEFPLPEEVAPMEEKGAVGRLSDGAALLRPLRVMAHRVEVTHAVEPADLAACRASAPAAEASAPAGAPAATSPESPR